MSATVPVQVHCGSVNRRLLVAAEALSISRVRPRAFLAVGLCQLRCLSRVSASAWPKPGPVCYGRSIAVVLAGTGARRTYSRLARTRGAGLKRGEGLAPLDGTWADLGEAAEARFPGLVVVAESLRGTYVVATAGSFA